MPILSVCFADRGRLRLAFENVRKELVRYIWSILLVKTSGHLRFSYESKLKVLTIAAVHTHIKMFHHFSYINTLIASVCPTTLITSPTAFNYIIVVFYRRSRIAYVGGKEYAMWSRGVGDRDENLTYNGNKSAGKCWY